MTRRNGEDTINLGTGLGTVHAISPKEAKKAALTVIEACNYNKPESTELILMLGLKDILTPSSD